MVATNGSTRRQEGSLAKKRHESALGFRISENYGDTLLFPQFNFPALLIHHGSPPSWLASNYELR
jgi:hypothetical protein